MKILQLLLLSFTMLFFLNCKKNKSTNCPIPNIYKLSNTINQFNFKKYSYWILKNTTTGVKDTLKVHYNSGLTRNSSSSYECQGDIYYSYYMGLYHTMFSSGITSIDMSGTNDGMTTHYYKYCACNQLSMFEKNGGDSITFNNNTNWSKIEAIYPSIIINGQTYANVYQMAYYPDLYDFKRIWWCPGIGFVKFEHFNTTTSQTEFWELDSYNVQLY